MRITVVAPPPGVLWALQLGRDELVKPSSAANGNISFDFTAEVVAAGTGFRLRGPAVQGRPGGRFVYLCIGTYAGQTDTPFARRAKVELESISRELVDAASKSNAALEARFEGADSKGEPVCATVKLSNGGWRIRR
ncbi:MAG: DUF5990 family protein [Steroidobacteraceae bacterium]